MPTYAYACRDCGHDFETVQSFSDDSLTVCPECGGNLRKVFANVGVVFKGSGFYRNDSRGPDSSASSSSTTDAGSGSGSSDKGGADKGSGDKKPAEPAAAKSSDKASKPAPAKSTSSGSSGSGSGSGSAA